MGLAAGVMLGELPTQKISRDWGMFIQVCFIFWDSILFFLTLFINGYSFLGTLIKLGHVDLVWDNWGMV